MFLPFLKYTLYEINPISESKESQGANPLVSKEIEIQRLLVWFGIQNIEAQSQENKTLLYKIIESTKLTIEEYKVINIAEITKGRFENECRFLIIFGNHIEFKGNSYQTVESNKGNRYLISDTIEVLRQDKSNLLKKQLWDCLKNGLVW